MAVSVTFMSGVVVGWLLNTYTRKVGQGYSPSSLLLHQLYFSTCRP